MSLLLLTIIVQTSQAKAVYSVGPLVGFPIGNVKFVIYQICSAKSYWLEIENGRDSDF